MMIEMPQRQIERSHGLTQFNYDQRPIVLTSQLLGLVEDPLHSLLQATSLEKAPDVPVPHGLVDPIAHQHQAPQVRPPPELVHVGLGNDDLVVVLFEVDVSDSASY